jgi:hypothetical protein
MFLLWFVLSVFAVALFLALGGWVAESLPRNNRNR